MQPITADDEVPEGQATSGIFQEDVCADGIDGDKLLILSNGKTLPLSTKLKALATELDKMLSSDATAKALLFSQWTR